MSDWGFLSNSSSNLRASSSSIIFVFHFPFRFMSLRKKQMKKYGSKNKFSLLYPWEPIKILLCIESTDLIWLRIVYIG